jgi:hypothetical protein
MRSSGSRRRQDMWVTNVIPATVKFAVPGETPDRFLELSDSWGRAYSPRCRMRGCSIGTVYFQTVGI